MSIAYNTITWFYMNGSMQMLESDLNRYSVPRIPRSFSMIILTIDAKTYKPQMHANPRGSK